MKKILNYWFRDGPHGQIMVINGPPRVGKTNLGCLIIESLRDMDFDVITTIRLKDPPKGVYHVAWFSQFLRAYAQKIKKDSVFIIDDAQDTMGTSLNVHSQKSQNNTRLILYIGKFQMNLIYIAHIPDYIPKNITKFDPLFIDKKSKKEMQIMGKRIRHIPKTNLEFETFSTSHWDYDVNLDKLWAELSIVPETDIKKTILKFLDDKGNKSKSNLTKAEKIKVILEFLEKDLGKTYNQSEIAKRIGVSRARITQIKNELSI